MYCEDISKTNQGGLRSQKVTPKKVIHHANEENLNTMPSETVPEV